MSASDFKPVTYVKGEGDNAQAIRAESPADAVRAEWDSFRVADEASDAEAVSPDAPEVDNDDSGAPAGFDSDAVSPDATPSGYDF